MKKEITYKVLAGKKEKYHFVKKYDTVDDAVNRAMRTSLDGSGRNTIVKTSKGRILTKY